MIFKNGFSIQLKQDRCLNQSQWSVTCNHCLDNCPSNAISTENGSVRLIGDLCGGCGLCLSDCPTQTFFSDKWDETTIVQTIKNENWLTTEFFCAIHTAPYKKDKNKQLGAVQVPACLAIISRGAWYEIGLTTKIQIHLEQCQNCVLSMAKNRLEYNIEVASEWLEASGHKPEFFYSFQSQQKKSNKSLKATKKGLSATSRRDLILSAIQKRDSEPKIIKNRQHAFIQHIDPIREGSLLPDWQKRLAEFFPRHMKRDTSPTYWPTIYKDKSCVNCGTCSAICPTQTLQIIVNDHECTHYFTSGLCLDCRLCQAFCPVDAITRSRKTVRQPFETQVVQTSKTTHCQRCDRPVFSSSSPLCHWCEEESSIDANLKKTCNTLFLTLES